MSLSVRISTTFLMKCFGTFYMNLPIQCQKSRQKFRHRNAAVAVAKFCGFSGSASLVCIHLFWCCSLKRRWVKYTNRS
jgi:hypothetical protein